MGLKRLLHRGEADTANPAHDPVMPQSQPREPSTPRTSNDARVTLLVDHTHAGVKYHADDQINVSKADAQWLRDNGIVGL